MFGAGDIETITTELGVADLDNIQKRIEKLAKDAKRGDKAAIAETEVLKKIEPHLNQGKPAITLELTPEEKAKYSHRGKAFRKFLEWYKASP